MQQTPAIDSPCYTPRATVRFWRPARKGQFVEISDGERALVMVKILASIVASTITLDALDEAVAAIITGADGRQPVAAADAANELAGIMRDVHAARWRARRR